MTYDAWYRQYMTLYKATLKERTREGYNDQHRRFISPIIGDQELRNITPEHIQIILNNTTLCGTRQAQAVYSLLHAVFARALKSWHIDRSPVDAIPKPRHTADSGAALDDREYHAVVPFVQRDLGLALALFAGLRRGEIVGLRWGDIDLPLGVIHVRRQRVRVNNKLVDQTLKSAAGLRDVPISPLLLPVLRRSYRFVAGARVVPVTPETIDKRWRTIQDRDVALSQHYRLHDLRHTYASQLVLKGCNLRVVQYLMGHSSLEVTARVYLHCSAEQAQTEAKRIYAAM